MEKLFFRAVSGVSYRLETRLDAQNQHHLTLYRDDTPVSSAAPQTLVLLRYLAKRPGRLLFEEDIRHDLWPDSTDPNIVEKYISLVRKTSLEDIGDKQERFIETHRKHGYTFTGEVRTEGEIGAVETYSKWDRARFYELIKGIHRGRDEENEDLRIATTAISSGSQEVDYRGLLRKGVRIRILLMNPKNDVLFNARNAGRKDKDTEQLSRQLTEQIGELEKLSRKHPRNEPPDQQGWLEYGLSNLMPCGCVFHTKHWAVLGVLLAHDTYVEGPMMEIRSESEAWETLGVDWQTRWDAMTEETTTKAVPHPPI